MWDTQKRRFHTTARSAEKDMKPEEKFKMDRPTQKTLELLGQLLDEIENLHLQGIVFHSEENDPKEILEDLKKNRNNIIQL